MRKTLYANRGETFKLIVRYLNESGQPIDLEAHSGSFFVKETNTSDLGWYHGSVGTDSDGYVTITVPASVTAGWANVNNYIVAVELDDDKTWLLSGTLNVGDY